MCAAMFALQLLFGNKAEVLEVLINFAAIHDLKD